MSKSLILGVYFLLMQFAYSAQPDLSKLREAISLPRLGTPHLLFHYNLGVPPFVEYSNAKLDMESQVADLRKSLQGDSSDASKYVDIGDLYADIKPDLDAKSAEAYASAFALYHKQLDKSPKDGYVMSQLGCALWRAKKWPDAEKWLRLGVRDSPRDWRCWANLADFLQAYGFTKVVKTYKFGPKTLTDLAEFQRILQTLVKGPGLDKSAQQLAAAMHEAYAAYDTAVGLAPNTSGVYSIRSRFRALDSLSTQNIFRIARGDAPIITPIEPRDTMEDVWKAADLDPDDLGAQSLALILEIIAHVKDFGGVGQLEKDKPLDKLPVDSRDRVSHAVQRLNKAAVSANKSNAKTALMSLILAYVLLRDDKDASLMAERALVVDPGNQAATEALASTDFQLKHFTELITEFQNLIKQADSPYRRLCLAKAYMSLNKPTEAAEQIHVGYCAFPSDFLLTLALTDETMKETADGSLKKAGDLIQQAQSLFEKLPPADQAANQTNLDLTRAAYLALVGKPDVARTALQSVLQSDPDNELAKTMLEALGEQH